MSNSGKPKTVERDGRIWELGEDSTVSWINRNTPGGLAITSAIPPCFERYATIARMEDFGSAENLLASQQRVIRVLRQHGATAGSLETSRRHLDSHVLPAIGEVRLGELTTPGSTR